MVGEFLHLCALSHSLFHLRQHDGLLWSDVGHEIRRIFQLRKGFQGQSLSQGAIEHLVVRVDHRTSHDNDITLAGRVVDEWNQVQTALSGWLFFTIRDLDGGHIDDLAVHIQCYGTFEHTLEILGVRRAGAKLARFRKDRARFHHGDGRLVRRGLLHRALCRRPSKFAFATLRSSQDRWGDEVADF